MFGLVFTAGRSRLARRRHRIEGARPIDPWRATIIQAENWAEYLGVELSSALRMHATALSVFFSCRYTLPVGASNTPPTGRALPVPVFRYIPGSSTDLSAENSNKVRTATLATARDTSGILKNVKTAPHATGPPNLQKLQLEISCTVSISCLATPVKRHLHDSSEIAHFKDLSFTKTVLAGVVSWQRYKTVLPVTLSRHAGTGRAAAFIDLSIAVIYACQEPETCERSCSFPVLIGDPRHNRHSGTAATGDIPKFSQSGKFNCLSNPRRCQRNSPLSEVLALRLPVTIPCCAVPTHAVIRASTGDSRVDSIGQEVHNDDDLTTSCIHECPCGLPTAGFTNSAVLPWPLQMRGTQGIPYDTRILDLRNNVITSLGDDSLENLTSLVALDLSQNRLTEFPREALKWLFTLSRLHLDGNAIATIPSNAFTAQRNLRELTLGSNRLTEVPVDALTSLSKLRRLALNENRINAIPNDAFRALSYLRLLALWNNCLEDIRPRGFQGLSRVSTIDLSHACLTRVPSEALKYVPRLTSLHMAHNEITSLPDDAFPNVPKLRGLTLNHNRIGLISANAFRGLARLEFLNLQENNLTRVPEAFKHVPSLTTLMLNRNAIRTLYPWDFRALQRLAHLYLAFNGFTTVTPEVFSELASLVTLDVSGFFNCDCRLRGFKEWIETTMVKVEQDLSCSSPPHLQGRQLRWIPRSSLMCGVRDAGPPPTPLHCPVYCSCEDRQVSCNNAQLTGVPGDIPDGAISLELSRNLITTVNSDMLLRLSDLQNLELNNNQLAAVPIESLQHLSELLSLGLSSNRLTDVPQQSFLGCPNLLRLDLSQNNLSSVPSEALVPLWQLHTLDISYNIIKNLGREVLAGLARLHVLVLNGNCFQALEEDVLLHVPNLRRLHLERTCLRSVPSTGLSGLNRLQQLDLSGNQLTSVPPGAFKGMPELRGLDLSENMISSIDSAAFHNLPRLDTITLNRNNLRFVPREALATLPTLSAVDLSRNKLRELDSRDFSGIRGDLTLGLSYNRIETVGADVLSSISSLRQVYLQGNPWACNCELRGLREWMDDSDTIPSSIGSAVERDVTCDSPTNLSGEAVVDVSADDLTCPENGNPPSFENYDDGNGKDQEGNPDECPHQCHCRESEISCSNRGITAVPHNIPKSTTFLDLGENKIENIHLLHFFKLQNLRTLILRDNRLSDFPLEALESLRSLQKLTMENNAIHSIPPDAFTSLLQLRELSLDAHNPESFSLGQLEPLKQLRKLVINGQSLPEIPARAFYGLSRLRILVLRLSCTTVIDARAFDDLDNLRRLDISGTCISNVGEFVKTLAQATALESLILAENGIKRIPRAPFLPMINLRFLDLSRNGVERIDAEAFRGISRLLSLTMDDNLLKSVPSEAFHHLPSLRILSLRNNSIKVVRNEDLVPLMKLTELHLDSNQIRSLGRKVFNELEDLSAVSISNNPFECDCGLKHVRGSLEEYTFGIGLEVEDMICAGPDFLTGKKIRALLEEDFVCGSDEQNKRAQILLEAEKTGNICPDKCECEDTEVTCIRRSLIEFPDKLPRTVTELSLSANHITDIPQHTVTGLDRLQYLRLNNNRLTSVPSDALKDLPSLKRLDLSGNNINTFADDAFRDLGNLTSLLLAENNLTEVPHSALKPLSHLQELYLGTNSIRKLTKSPFPYLKNLRFLSLSGNCMKMVEHDAFNRLRNLLSLDLSRTSLKHVPSNALSQLGQLRTLDLSQNDIRYVHGGAFRGLEQLRVLYIARNRIGAIHNRAFEGLVHLTAISLFDNKLRRIPGALQSLPLLSQVTISRNRLRQIRSIDVPRLAGMATLSLRENRIDSINPSVFSAISFLRRLSAMQSVVCLGFENKSWEFCGLGEQSRRQSETETARERVTEKTVPAHRLPCVRDGNACVLRVFLLALYHIDLDRNPWRCDCHLRGLREWLEDHVDIVNPRLHPACAGPTNLQDKRLIDILPEDFTCSNQDGFLYFYRYLTTRETQDDQPAALTATPDGKKQKYTRDDLYAFHRRMQRIMERLASIRKYLKKRG
ncbi:hypothetical protein Bbelb_431340 [Branchiostoma belcheri]|nr:hypothetical protein Bbelb_431340 [Branchiostoma belcheri]